MWFVDVVLEWWAHRVRDYIGQVYAPVPLLVTYTLYASIQSSVLDHLYLCYRPYRHQESVYNGNQEA